MSRHHRRKPTSRELGDLGLGRIERGPRGDERDYRVVQISSARARKTYQCPGCNNTIIVDLAHVVAWPAESGGDDRRHWHSGCWRGRGSRTG